MVSALAVRAKAGGMAITSRREIKTAIRIIRFINCRETLGLDSPTFKILLTPAGQEAVHRATNLDPREAEFLAHFQRLSRHYPADLARAALEIAILRARAVEKFPFADRMYFTREALEQASSYEVSSYRAERYKSFSQVADLGCSIGGDTISLARVAPSLGIDQDPVRLLMAQENSRALGLSERSSFLRADLTRLLPLRPYPDLAFFFDPARRAEGRRFFSIHAYRPPLDLLPCWLTYFPATGVKISPGIRLEELSAYDAEVEFISLRGELKEAVLWFGPLRSARWRATVLPGPHTLSTDGQTSQLPDHPGKQAALPLTEPLAFLYEPDPAVIRSGLLTELGVFLEAAQLDKDIAYLTAEKLTPTPFARAWVVEDWFPFNLKRLRAYLRQRGVGRVVVKKRGSPIQPEALIRDLRLQGEQERHVFLTHLRGKPVAVICNSVSIIN